MGMQPGTLRVPFESWNAERPLRHSHAERGNDRTADKKKGDRSRPKCLACSLLQKDPTVFSACANPSR
ncbi:hypothetical protein BZL43_11200 [Pseudomonas sp. PICF141]|nr:hypothetical protein BZL43_11200 [Pseudomonas sp. PICF141]